MDGAHVPHQVPWKLAPRWFGPYRVREVKGAACTLDLPDTLGKTSDKVNVRRLKFFEERDAQFGDYQGPVQPTLDPLGVRRYEIQRIVAHRVFHRRPEYWVQWAGYDAAWDMWVHRDVLLDDVPDMVVAYHDWVACRCSRVVAHQSEPPWAGCCCRVKCHSRMFSWAWV